MRGEKLELLVNKADNLATSVSIKTSYQLIFALIKKEECRFCLNIKMGFLSIKHRTQHLSYFGNKNNNCYSLIKN